MASEWEKGMGSATPSPAPAYLYGLPSTDTLHIDDLLDFSNQDIFASSATIESHHIPHQPAISSGAARESGSSSSDCCYPQLSSSSSFADDIYITSKEAAELEWLSKFVEDSFYDAPYPAASIPHTHIPTADSASNPSRGARSKRSRASAASAAALTDGSSKLDMADTDSAIFVVFIHVIQLLLRLRDPKKEEHGERGPANNGIGVDESGVRCCTHCGSEKTPQWRTGPLGPKTLCNACGVRHKSGRLVPEYRPAASPTFVLTQHSNSHRKVMELRMQKEVQHPRQPNNNSVTYHDILLSLS